MHTPRPKAQEAGYACLQPGRGDRKGGRGDAPTQALDFAGSATSLNGGKVSIHATRWCLPCHGSAQKGRLNLPTWEPTPTCRQAQESGSLEDLGHE